MEIDINKPTESDTKIGILSGLLGVIGSPKATFERLVQSPRTWLPSFILVLLTALFTLPFISKFQEYGLILAKKTLALTPEAATAAGSGVDISQIVATTTTVSTIIGIILSAFLAPLILAALIKLLNLVMGETAGFKKIWTVTVFASVPSLIDVLLSNVLMFMSNSDHLVSVMVTKTSLASLVSFDSVPGFVFSLLANLNIFTIWTLVLTVIGVAHLFRSKTSKVAFVIFGVWILFGLVSAYYGQSSLINLMGS